ncbi:MAG: hypothetical protein K2N94_06935 [Lachnospiraceae bacterium]|nr:hypothetical protein [Lachnospiraceae bacterium]
MSDMVETEDGGVRFRLRLEDGTICDYVFTTVQIGESDWHEPGTAPDGIPGEDLNDETDYYVRLSSNASYDDLQISYMPVKERTALPTGIPGEDSDN